jgi:hypothetical protein
MIPQQSKRAAPRKESARQYSTVAGNSAALAVNSQSDHARKRLPAYAKPLADLRRRGLRPAAQVVVVRDSTWPPSWHIGADGEEIEGRAPAVRWPQVVVPADADPELIDFGFARGLSVMLAVRPSVSPKQRVRAALNAILAAGPADVTVLDMERPGRSWYFAGAEVQA